MKIAYATVPANTVIAIGRIKQTLLFIAEHIDDPDARYRLDQSASGDVNGHINGWGNRDDISDIEYGLEIDTVTESHRDSFQFIFYIKDGSVRIWGLNFEYPDYCEITFKGLYSEIGKLTDVDEAIYRLSQ